MMCHNKKIKTFCKLNFIYVLVRDIPLQDDAGQIENKQYESQIQESTNEAENKYECDKCDRTYAGKPSLLLHQRQKHETYFQFKCDFCSFTAKHGSDLLSHVNSEHLANCDKPREKYKCKVCGNNYSRKQSLLFHKTTTKHIRRRPLS